MALTPETIKANESLATLTEAQIAAIATLSVNDEATVINTKIGEHHGLVERDVKEISGIDKQEGEKSYDYMKRVLSDFKKQTGGATELQGKIAAQEVTIRELTQKIADGKGNEVMAQQLKDAESKMAALQTQYQNDKTVWETEKKGYAEKITGIQVNSEFGKATSSLKFKAGYPEAVQKTLLDSAKSGILSKYTPDWVEADGTKTMVFRDAKGEIVRNRANGLNPYTAQELISESLKEVLDYGQKKQGTGTDDPGKQGADNVEIVDIVGAKTQVEADALIVKHLLQKGLTRGSAEFADQQKKIRTENSVEKLPMR
jgi:uncharacterized coiled-coil protein SlyX